jgi:hypothetical protein
MSNASRMSLRFSSVPPTNAKVTSGQEEQELLRSGSPLGVTLNSNSGFMRFSVDRFSLRFASSSMSVLLNLNLLLAEVSGISANQGT